MEPRSFVLTGTRGGMARTRLLAALDSGPVTVRELAASLGMGRGRAREHLEVLQDNGLVEARDAAEGTVYATTGAAASIPVPQQNAGP